MDKIFKIVFLPISIILLSNVGIIAQNYTEKNKEDFTKVYFSLKENKKSYDQKVAALMSRYDIKPADMNKLMSKGKNNPDQGDLKSSEKLFVESFKNLEKERQLEVDSLTMAVCLEQDIEYDLYKQMLEKYRSDIIFQRSMKPFFDLYLKNKRK